MKINISMTTATELAQISSSESGTGDKIGQIKIKEQKVLVDTGDGVKTLITPYYTGNSFRGKLRRASTQMLLETAIKKDIAVTADAFHLMNAGGGPTYSRQLFKIEEKVRELNPLISLFGASLAISGKLITPNLMPYKEIVDGQGVYYYSTNEEDGSIYSNITAKNLFIKTDDLLDRRGNAKFMSDEAILEWQSRAAENAQNVAKSRNTDTKVKKETLKTVMNQNFIIRGVDFYSSLGEIGSLTQIEKGLLYRSLEIVILDSLGAYKSKGFGLCNYKIEFEDGSVIETKINEYLQAEIIKKDYKEDTADAIAAFDKWLENIDENNLMIEKVLVKNK